MGNAEILPRRLGGDPVEPPLHRVIWQVYRLREQGNKLSREDVLRTGKAGFLHIWRTHDGGVSANLVDVSGYPTLEALSSVRLAGGPLGGGLVLHGHVLSTKGGKVSEVPQAWWCVVQSLLPTQRGKIAGCAQDTGQP